jgi:hypothetical protein
MSGVIFMSQAACGMSAHQARHIFVPMAALPCVRSATSLMTEQVEKLMYELSMWRATPELKARRSKSNGLGGTPACSARCLPDIHQTAPRPHSQLSCAAILQARAQQVQARHNGGEGEFLETKKNTYDVVFMSINEPYRLVLSDVRARLHRTK